VDKSSQIAATGSPRAKAVFASTAMRLGTEKRVAWRGNGNYGESVTRFHNRLDALRPEKINDWLISPQAHARSVGGKIYMRLVWAMGIDAFALYWAPKKKKKNLSLYEFIRREWRALISDRGRGILTKRSSRLSTIYVPLQTRQVGAA
jgi:hypothetical protein